MNFTVRLGCFVALISPATVPAGFNQVPSKTSEGQIILAKNHLRDAQILLEKEKFAQAEALARTAIEELDAAGVYSAPAHLVAGKALLFQQSYKAALPEVTWRLRMDKGTSQNLLYTIAGSHADLMGKSQVFSAIVAYQVRNQREINERLGELEWNRSDHREAVLAGIAALLYAADSSTSPGEALLFLKMAESELPKHPQVALVRGFLELKGGKNLEAQRDLQFAVKSGSPQTVQKARELLAKIKS